MVKVAFFVLFVRPFVDQNRLNTRQVPCGAGLQDLTGQGLLAKAFRLSVLLSIFIALFELDVIAPHAALRSVPYPHASMLLAIHKHTTAVGKHAVSEVEILVTESPWQPSLACDFVAWSILMILNLTVAECTDIAFILTPYVVRVRVIVRVPSSLGTRIVDVQRVRCATGLVPWIQIHVIPR